MTFNNDSDFIGRFKRGDVSAFETLVQTYQDRVYNLCRYMLQDPSYAQDAAQDVFLKAYRALKDFRPDASLYTWLYRIVINTCRDYIRKSARQAARNEPLEDELPSDERSPQQLYEAVQMAQTIQLALQRLPEKLRTAIVLREMEGLSYEEIAEVLHTSTGTVKSRISRARERLRPILLKKL